MTWKTALLLLLGLLIGGCAHRPFMVGVYDASRESLPELRAAGFDFVTIGWHERNRREFLDAAQTNDLRVIVWPHLKTAEGRAAMAKLDKHPALWAWQLFDEPDLNVFSPEQVEEIRRSLRKVARKPTYLVVASGAAVERYRGIANVIAVDWYPVPWSPVATVSREMRTARLAAQGRPFFAILQAFDWTAYREMILGDQELRPPTREELRCMAYLSLLQGARGILFYTYEAKGWKSWEHPETWQAVVDLTAELKAVAPVFEERVRWFATQTRYEDPNRMYNDIHEGAVALNVFRVRERRGSVAAGYYIVAINTTDSDRTFAYRRPFGEGEWVDRNYAPFEVFIDGPHPGPLAKERFP
jgi:hypothetical protein